MRTKIKTITIGTKRINTFAPEIQWAFAAVCQHIDWLFRRTGEPFQHKALPGSDSWLPRGGADYKVVIKALPWDKRMRTITGQYSHSDGGVIVLVRDLYLTKDNMRVLWEEYGQVYHPCPSSPLYNVPLRPDKAFQMLLLSLGGDCDLLSLPGVDQSKFPTLLQDRPKDGIIVASDISNESSQAAEDNPSGPGIEIGSPEIAVDMARIVAALGELLKRAVPDTLEHRSH